MRSDERRTLKPWVDAFTSYFGENLEFQPLGVEHPDAPEDLQRILFPDVIRPPELIGGIGHFSHQPNMCTYVRSLGFDWNQHGRICATPTPSTFRWLVDQTEKGHRGYAPSFFVFDQDYMCVGPWLDYYLQGKIPLHIRSEVQYSRWLPISKQFRAHGHGFHLGSILHDMTVHMLNYHLIPQEWVENTSSKIRISMPDRVQSWQPKDAPGPLTLSYFFDNDLNVYCQQVWCRCTGPEDFEGIFMKKEHVSMINSALDLRIQQTLEGKGDVPSGDTNDVECLKQLDFRLP